MTALIGHYNVIIQACVTKHYNFFGLSISVKHTSLLNTFKFFIIWYEQFGIGMDNKLKLNNAF